CNFTSEEGSSSGKHDYKSCLPSEVKDIKNTALTQFDLHYQKFFRRRFLFWLFHSLKITEVDINADQTD
ncbi:hypothetical protein, partial [Hallella multisaccharivorax]|uniref:hypothetical protein n=1 Tax=Hallella multisaccharivorax TaxID=310514 RepID=UPI0036103689